MIAKCSAFASIFHFTTVGYFLFDEAHIFSFRAQIFFWLEEGTALIYLSRYLNQETTK